MNKEQLKTYLNITENQYLGIDTIDGDVDLGQRDSCHVTEIPKGFNPNVVGYLDLDSVTKIPNGFSPIVGGYLNLHSVTEIPKGFNPTVGGGLYLNNVTKIPKGFNPTVSGTLDLRSVTEIPKGFNPTVGGYLDLDSVTKISRGFSPTVGRNLYLRSVTEIPKGFNPTVGGDLYARLNIPHTKLGNNPITWNDGKYILVDGIFTEVVYKKGNVYQVKRLNNPKEFYLVTDGTKWAHGDTLKEAYQDLVYKVTNRNKEDFEHLTLDSVLTFEESIACYRTITGACSFGTRHFVESNGFEKTDRTVREIIELTKDSYGSNSFNQFFSK